MLKSLGLLAIAILLQVAPLLPKAPTQSGDHSPTAETQQQPETPPPVVVKTDNQVTSDESSKKDAIATEDPDEWVIRGFWINTALVLITLLIAIATLMQARAAKGAIELSRNTAKRQLRAYLCVDEACVKITENQIIGGESYTLMEGQLHIKNGGETPAYDVRSWTHSRISIYPEGTPVDPPPKGFARSVEIVPTQGKRIMTTKETAESSQVMGLLKNQTVAYVVQAQVLYRDIFKDWHCLRIRMFFGGPGGVRTTKDKNGITLGYLVPDSWGNVEEDVPAPDDYQNPN